MSDYRIEAATKEEWAERALKAEDARDKAIHQLSEISRKLGEAEGKLAASEMAGIVEGWKARALKAEQTLGELLAIIHRDGGHYQARHGDEAAVNQAHHAWAALIARAEKAEAKAERLKAAFIVNALGWNPNLSHAEINAEIERILNQGQI